MTPGNDAEWLTDLAIGLTNTTTGESDDPLQFTASIYYPNSTETFSYLDAMRGTLNPRDGDLTTNAETGAIDNTGTQYIPGYNNVPRSGGFIAYEALQDGSLIIPIRVTSNKSLFVVEDDGHVKTDIQFKDADGNTLTLLPSPLCAVSSEYVMGFLSFNVEQGRKYYVFCNGSKPRFAGYVFSTERISIDSETMKDVLDLLLPLTPQDVEVFAIDATTELMPNEPLQATRSVTMTPGNDSAWGVRLLEDNKHALKFTASSYYPGSTSSYTFWGGARGTNPAKDGDLTEGGNSGDAYDYTIKNTPKSGAYVTFEVSQSGSLIIPMHVPTNKPLYVIDSNGKVKTDIQFVDTLGQVVPMLAEPLCVFSETASTPGYLSFNVTPGGKYTIFITGGVDLRYGGYVFSTESITIDPVTMANVKSILEAEPYAVLSENNTVLTFYYDNQKETRGGFSIKDQGGSNTPTPSVDTNGTEAKPYTVEDAITVGSGTNVFVKAYIVGWIDGSTFGEGAKFNADAIVASNIIIAATPDETDISKCMPVQLPSGAVRSAVNLQDNAGNYKKEILIVGNIEKYFGTTGVKSVSYAKIGNTEVGTKPDSGGNTPTPSGDNGTATAPLTVAQAIALIDAESNISEAYVKGKISQIDSYNATYKSITYWISDDGATITQLQVYSGKGLNGADFNSKEDLTVGQTVVIKGALKMYSSVYEFDKNSSIISIDGAGSRQSGARRNRSSIITDYAETITKVVFDESFANYYPTSTASWFQGCTSLSDITGIENLKTDNVTRMDGMFEGCSSLTSLDLRYFNTVKVTDMMSMFSGCSSLKYINFGSNFKTDNVTYMTNMFLGCSRLTSLDVSGFKTDNVITMAGMFYGCSSLTSLDLRNFNTENVTNMEMMFQDCYRLKELNVSTFNTAKVETFFQMFLNCNSLEYLDVSSFNTEKATSMRWMFGDCYKLKSLDLSRFNTQKVTHMGEMFHSDYSLTSLDLSNFNTENVKVMWSMFLGCSGLTTLDISNFNTEKVTEMQGLFRFCSSLRSLNISNFNTTNVTNMSSLFDGCPSLASIQAGNAVIPDSVYAQIGNPNLLLYVNEASLAPASVTNVVVDGAAENIVLTDVEQGNNNFYCPQEFTARRISYTHNYRQATQVGVSRGWETIVLPFTVQTITHEKNGLLAPFGVDGGKPFWLRQLTENGLVSAQQIEANMPYLISMPNNGRYPADYNQAGNVTFSANNVVVPMTEQREMSGNNRMLIPTTMRVAQSPSVYAINRNASYENNPEGSIFVADYREVRPFEAYVEHTNGARFISLDDLSEGDVTNIQAIHDIASADVVKVYNLSGVLLKTGKRQEVMSQLPKGIYIVNGVKVVVK